MILLFQKFDIPFDINNDESDYQIGGVSFQDQKRVTFFSRKLTKPQKIYPTTKEDILSTMETLEMLCMILQESSTKVYTTKKT